MSPLNERITMRVDVVDSDDRNVTYTIDGHPVSLASTEPFVRPAGDAEVALGFLSALKARENLLVDLPMSGGLRRGLPQLQRIFGTWMDRPAVEISTESDQAGLEPAAKLVGCFFSGGVDSFFTALRHRAEIDYLIFVHGFDISVDDEALSVEALHHAREAAASLGKVLIEVRTDLRRYSPIGDDWGMTHGSAMAFVAHSLSTKLGKVYIPSTYTYKDMFPWGSHPMTDPLWSGSVELVHDGADRTRMEKLAYLAAEPVTYRHLRVCWENRNGRFNCCECEKCTRTMIALRVLGALEKFTTFDRPLRLNRVRYGIIRDTAQLTFTRQVLAQVRAEGADPALANALRWRLRIGPRRQALRTNGYSLYKKLGKLVG